MRFHCNSNVCTMYLWEVLLSVLLAAVAHYLVDGQVGTVPVAQTNGGTGPADLLHGNAVVKVTQPQSTILFYGVCVRV